MSKPHITSRPLTAEEQKCVRPACIWLDFGEDDECNLLSFGVLEIDAVVNGKIVKRKVRSFLRVYEGAEGPYVYPDCKLPYQKIRYWKRPEGNKYVTDKNGDPICGWENIFIA